MCSQMSSLSGRNSSLSPVKVTAGFPSVIPYKPTSAHHPGAGYPRATLVIRGSHCALRKQTGWGRRKRKKALIDRSGKTQLQR